MTARAEELKEPNPYRQQTVTAMDEYGNITEIGDSDGVIGEERSPGIGRSSRLPR